MKAVVIDACVVASWFLPGEEEGKYAPLIDHLASLRIHVPAIFRCEFINILLMAERRKRISHAIAAEILAIINCYPITIDVKQGSFQDGMSLINLAQEHNLSIYDASYLELSLRHDAIPLLTYDKALNEAVKKLRIKNKI